MFDFAQTKTHTKDFVLLTSTPSSPPHSLLVSAVSPPIPVDYTEKT